MRIQEVFASLPDVTLSAVATGALTPTQSAHEQGVLRRNGLPAKLLLSLPTIRIAGGVRRTPVQTPACRIGPQVRIHRSLTLSYDPHVPASACASSRGCGSFEWIGPASHVAELLIARREELIDGELPEVAEVERDRGLDGHRGRH